MSKVISKSQWLEETIPRVMAKGWIMSINPNGYGWTKTTCPLCRKFMAGVVFKHPKTVGKTLVLCGSCRKMMVQEPKPPVVVPVPPPEPVPAPVASPGPLFQTGL